jgi:RNA polymerase sigma-70 factor (ECF subfamily)
MFYYAVGRLRPGVEGGVARAQLHRENVNAALHDLSPRDQELIRLKHFEDLSYREIAERLGLTVTNVGVSLSRAENRLRRILESHV